MVVEYQNVVESMVNQKRQVLPELSEDELIQKFKSEEGCILSAKIPALQVNLLL